MRELPEGYVITDAMEEDIPALIAADRAASALFAPTGLLSPEALADYIPSNVFETEIPAGNVICARASDQRPVGFALIRHRGSGLYLDQVSVHPDHGCKGIGRALMIRVLTVAEQRKLPHVSLSTFRDLPWNGPFYASMGFREMARDKLEPFMFEIEEAQKPYMDVATRCFMRRKVRRPLFRFKKSKQEAL